MLMPASSEFVALCRSQVALLTQTLGATLSVVYLTEDLTGDTESNLVPVAAYPETAASWQADQLVQLMSRGIQTSFPALRMLSAGKGVEMELPLRSLSPVTEPPVTESPVTESDELPRLSKRPQSRRQSKGVNKPTSHPNAYSMEQDDTETSLEHSQQIVLPLVHEGVMMGLLVTARSDRSWVDAEHVQMERIARTLAIACVLDQRAQWAKYELAQQRQLQAQQRDIFDDLLHQFRNPLTALRTFGKLLLRRMMTDDANRNSVEGIVRESDRLQDLLRQFDAAIELGSADVLPPATEGGDQSQLGAGVPVPLNTGLGAVQRDQTGDRAEVQPQGVPLLPETNYLTGTLTIAPYPIADVVEPLLNSAAAIAQDRQIHLQTSIPPNLPTIQADLKALREVINNLLDNALKYTPTGGSVWLLGGIQRSPDFNPMQAIAILDNGPGIPSEDLAQLFKRHFRGVQAEGTLPGSGLGLAIARDLITQMQGEIQAFSPAYQSGLVGADVLTGTAFLVWLPEAKELKDNV